MSIPGYLDLYHEACSKLAQAERDKAELRLLVGTAQADANRKALTNVALRAEVDRLKGELAEARRLIAKPFSTCPWCLTETDTHYSFCSRQKFLAAKPAEQAQPTAKCGRCGNTEGKVVTVAGKLQFQCGHASCWPPTPIEPVEQAQGEAAAKFCADARPWSTPFAR